MNRRLKKSKTDFSCFFLPSLIVSYENSVKKLYAAILPEEKSVHKFHVKNILGLSSWSGEHAYIDPYERIHFKD